MFETLSTWSAQPLVTYAVAAMGVFFSIDLWRRCVQALQVLGDTHSRARRATTLVLAVWLLLALAMTLVPALRELANLSPRFQPAVTLLGVIGVTALMLLPAARRAFDQLPLADLMTLFYWRAIFGMGLLAFYTGAALPSAFALPAAFGDMLVTCVMVVLLTVAQRRGSVPRRPLLVWNTLGLIDLVNAMFLVATVLRPWAASRGISAGNFVLAGFVVPLFIGIHLHLYGRLFRERAARSTSPSITLQGSSS
jgi:hypothetical protein